MKNKNAKKFTGLALNGEIILQSGFTKNGTEIMLIVDTINTLGLKYHVASQYWDVSEFFSHKKQAQKFFQKTLDTYHLAL